MIFANQGAEAGGAFEDRRLKAFAESLELDTARFNECFDGGRYKQDVLADERYARSLGVNGTPTVFINKKLVNDPLNYAALKQMIDAALASSP
jgi:protein-disulfide isomerase